MAKRKPPLAPPRMPEEGRPEPEPTPTPQKDSITAFSRQADERERIKAMFTIFDRQAVGSAFRYPGKPGQWRKVNNTRAARIRKKARKQT